MRSLLLMVAMALAGCDAVRDVARESLDPKEVERQLRQDPARPGKVGAIVALGTRQQAIFTARRMLAAPNPECAWRAYEAPGVLSLTLSLTLARPASPPLSWLQTTTLTRDARSNLSLSDDTAYTQETGQTGTRQSAWVLHEGEVFVSHDRARFVRVDEPSPWRRAAWVLRYTSMMQGLLDAAPGWERAAGESVWSAGSQALTCGPAPQATAQAWWRTWASQAVLEHARFEVGQAQERALKMRWSVPGQGVLTLRLDEAWRPDEEAEVAVPALKDIASMPSRSWREVERALERLEREGWTKKPLEQKEEQEAP